MAMRKKELGALGMQVNEKGQVIAKSGLLSAMETQLIEESGLKCCICLEGYKNQPQKVSSCPVECGGRGFLLEWVCQGDGEKEYTMYVSILQILGIYTYTRKIALDEFENKPRKTLVSTMTYDPMNPALVVCRLRCPVTLCCYGYDQVCLFPLRVIPPCLISM